MALVNYYKVLQVDPLADPEVIAAAYKRLALKTHPDTNGASAESKARMQALNEAYAVLGDPLQRTAYDRRLAAEEVASQSQRSERDTPNTTRAAPPQPNTPEPNETGLEPLNTRTIVIYLAIAAVLLAVVLLGFRTISPLELGIVLVVSLLLVQPVSAWLSNRTRR